MEVKPKRMLDAAKFKMSLIFIPTVVLNTKYSVQSLALA
jgi:hypothetical protein